jgi:hypothetical protein
VPKLVRELRVRLVDLDQERRAITKALRALEPASPRERPAKLDQALLERLRTSPRSRASMLAFEFGADVEDIASALKRLEDGGRVKRIGMGWEVVGRKSRGRRAT